MRRGITRWVTASLLVILGAAFPAAGVAFASQNSHAAGAARGAPEIDQPGIDERDREFIRLIKFANLWEIPTAQLGIERGTTEAFKTAGQTMVKDHTALNTAVKQLSDKFGVGLPTQPTAAQQQWMGEISSKKGKDFDKAFATRLRDAHGSVFSSIAEERASTRNKTMRDFATQANTIVMRHMTLLEATGYVSTAHGMVSEAGNRSADNPENRLDKGALIAAAVIFLVVATGTVLGVRIMSARGAAT
jgi:putative membrane protein